MNIRKLLTSIRNDSSPLAELESLNKKMREELEAAGTFKKEMLFLHFQKIDLWKQAKFKEDLNQKTTN